MNPPYSAAFGTGDIIVTTTLLAYRISAYFMLTLLDDPAMLALAFC